MELPTGDAAPGATVSHFSLFLPTPIHFPSPTFLIFTRESRGATVSPGEVGVRGGGEAGRRALGGGEREERLILDAISACLAVKLDSSHTPAVCRAPRSSFYFFFFPPGCKMRQADGVVQAPPPPRLVLSPRGKRGVLSQPSSLTTFPSHSGVIKKRALCPPPPLSLLSIPSGVFFSSRCFA